MESDAKAEALAPNADLKLTGDAYGTPIAYVEGHPLVAGSIIWASDKREIAHARIGSGQGKPVG